MKDKTKQKILTEGPLDTTSSSHGWVDSGPEAKGGMTWLHIRRCTIESVGTWHIDTKSCLSESRVSGADTVITVGTRKRAG